MYLFKNSFSRILLCSMVIIMLGLITANADIGDNFEDGLLNNWFVASGVSATIENDAINGKYLVVEETDNTATTKEVSRLIEPKISGTNVILEFKLKTISTGGTDQTIFIKGGTNNYIISRLTLCQNGICTISDGSNNKAYYVNIGINNWSNIKYIFNTNTQKYNFYVNYRPVVIAANFEIKDSTYSISKFHLALSQKAKLYIDDFNVYNSLSESFDLYPSITYGAGRDLKSDIDKVSSGALTRIDNDLDKAGFLTRCVNNTSKSKNATSLLALYEDNRLKQVIKSKDEIIPAYTSQEILSIPNNGVNINFLTGKNYKLKLFTFDFSIISPLAKLQQIEFTQPLVPLSVEAVFRDNMVLQRNKKVNIFGRANTGEDVTVSFAGQTKTTKAINGKWMIEIDPLTASFEGRTLTVSSQSGTVNINNVVVGDVWYASGQSNMAFTMREMYGNTTVSIKSHDVNIRYFRADRTSGNAKYIENLGDWKVLDNSNISSMSAVAYYFASDIQATVNVPIGIIDTSWGGTMIETWMNPKLFFENDDFKSAKEAYREQTVLQGSATQLSTSSAVPGKLFETRVNRIIPYSVTGVLWYQGESNVYFESLYAKQIEAMIKNWRDIWSDNALPVYIVQLPKYLTNTTSTGALRRDLALMREVQYEVSKKLNNCYAEVIIDTGDINDIHPKDKDIVGKRLSLLAKDKTYGQDLVSSGPLVTSVMRDTANKQMIVTFLDDGNSNKIMRKDSGGVLYDSGSINAFEITGDGVTYYPADAVLINNTVLVSSPNVSNPIHIRYAYSSSPGVNLVNDSGLPTVPFRTETMPSIVTTLPYENKFWTPAMLADKLTLWLDAQDENTFVKSGTNITKWNDKSGKGRNVTGANSPQYTQNGINGKVAVGLAKDLGRYFIYDGNTGEDWSDFKGDLSVYSVFNLSGYASNMTQADLFSLSNKATTTTQYRLGMHSSFGYQFRRLVDGTNYSDSNSNDMVLNKNLILGGIYSGTTVQGFKDGTAITTPTTATGSMNGINALTIGARRYSNVTYQYANGYIGEVIATKTALTTVEREKLEGYLAWKWGLESNLPSNHPYKTTPPKNN